MPPQHKPSRSLLCLLQGLKDITTTIELRNEITVHGKIDNVDDHMNVTVSLATYKLLNGHKEVFEQLFIKGSQIRYVLIPNEVNVMKTMIKQVNEESVKSCPKFSKQKILPSRLKRHEEERKMVREYILGRGRHDNTKETIPTKLSTT